jgi:outer membrane lipoprotein-sorting protein
MHERSCLQPFVFLLLLLLLLTPLAQAQQMANAPLPDIPQFMREVEEHQKELDKVRENYTYTSLRTIQDLNSSGQVTKTERKSFRSSSSTAISSNEW